MVTRTLFRESVASPGLTRSLPLAWREARPIVQVIFMLRFLAGCALGATHAETVAAPVAVTAGLSWLAITWAVYLLNGVADVVEDRANGSARPIASRRLPESRAERLAWGLATFGLVLAALVSSVMLVLALLMLAVGWAYSMGPYPLKRNMAGFFLAVVALGVLTYLAGWHASGAGRPQGSVLLFGLMMSLWMGLAGSTKDLSDTRGDRLAGRRTLPVLFGEHRARVIMAGAACVVGWTFMAVGAAQFGQLLPAAVTVCVGASALAVIALTSISRGDRTRERRPYRAFMVTQYVAHLTLFGCLALTLTGW